MKNVFLAMIVTAIGTVAYAGNAGDFESLKAESGVKFGETLVNSDQIEANSPTVYLGGQEGLQVNAIANTGGQAIPVAKATAKRPLMPKVPTMMADDGGYCSMADLGLLMIIGIVGIVVGLVAGVSAIAWGAAALLAGAYFKASRDLDAADNNRVGDYWPEASDGGK